jgi:Ca2+-binding RTX toxin-like protein
VVVTFNGALFGTFQPTSRILVFAGAGNDTVTVLAGSSILPILLNGGAGADRLAVHDSEANNVLLGGTGADLLIGSKGRDLLIGGTGPDLLIGGPGDDILIGSSTSHDEDIFALMALMTEWGRTDIGFRTRTGHLRGVAAGGLNGTIRLSAATVRNASTTDILFGGQGKDWLWAPSRRPAMSRF